MSARKAGETMVLMEALAILERAICQIDRDPRDTKKEMQKLNDLLMSFIQLEGRIDYSLVLAKIESELIEDLMGFMEESEYSWPKTCDKIIKFFLRKRLQMEPSAFSKITATA